YPLQAGAPQPPASSGLLPRLGPRDRPLLDEAPVGDHEPDRGDDRSQADREVVRLRDVAVGVQERRRDPPADNRAGQTEERGQPDRHRVGPRHRPARQAPDHDAGEEDREERAEHLAASARRRPAPGPGDRAGADELPVEDKQEHRAEDGGDEARAPAEQRPHDEPAEERAAEPERDRAERPHRIGPRHRPARERSGGEAPDGEEDQERDHRSPEWYAAGLRARHPPQAAHAVPQRLSWTSATQALWCWWPLPASVSTMRVRAVRVRGERRRLVGGGGRALAARIVFPLSSVAQELDTPAGAKTCAPQPAARRRTRS